jgi:hypothetical protein
METNYYYYGGIGGGVSVLDDMVGINHFEFVGLLWV